MLLKSISRFLRRNLPTYPSKSNFVFFERLMFLHAFSAHSQVLHRHFCSQHVLVADCFYWCHFPITVTIVQGHSTSLKPVIVLLQMLLLCKSTVGRRVERQLEVYSNDEVSVPGANTVGIRFSMLQPLCIHPFELIVVGVALADFEPSSLSHFALASWQWEILAHS